MGLEGGGHLVVGPSVILFLHLSWLLAQLAALSFAGGALNYLGTGCSSAWRPCVVRDTAGREVPAYPPRGPGGRLLVPPCDLRHQIRCLSSVSSSAGGGGTIRASLTDLPVAEEVLSMRVIFCFPPHSAGNMAGL